jgi:hypothetical protein
MMWVKPGPIVARLGEYQLFYSSDGGISFSIYNDTFSGVRHDRTILFWDGSLNHIIVGTTRLTPGQWYHVAVTSTGVGGERQLYVNGAVETKRFFGTSGVDAGHSNGWPAGGALIGAFNDRGGRWHDSTIDDVRIYDTALSQEEIEDVFSGEPSVPRFSRGDSNSDESMNIADAVYILQNLFANGPAILCMDAGDSNDDGGVNIADAVYILQHLFADGPEPPFPFLTCGYDPTADELECTAYAPCDDLGAGVEGLAP